MTTSNDGTAVLRSKDGQQIGVLPHPLQEDGSPPFVLDWFAMLIPCMYEHTYIYLNFDFVFRSCEVCAPSGMDTVSCAEDGSVMVWSGTDSLQYVPHPNTVWFGTPNLPLDT